MCVDCIENIFLLSAIFAKTPKTLKLILARNAIISGQKLHNPLRMNYLWENFEDILNLIKDSASFCRKRLNILSSPRHERWTLFGILIPHIFNSEKTYRAQKIQAGIMAHHGPLYICAGGRGPTREGWHIIYLTFVSRLL